MLKQTPNEMLTCEDERKSSFERHKSKTGRDIGEIFALNAEHVQDHERTGEKNRVPTVWKEKQRWKRHSRARSENLHLTEYRTERNIQLRKPTSATVVKPKPFLCAAKLHTSMKSQVWRCRQSTAHLDYHCEAFKLFKFSKHSLCCQISRLLKVTFFFARVWALQ